MVGDDKMSYMPRTHRTVIKEQLKREGYDDMQAEKYIKETFEIISRVKKRRQLERRDKYISFFKLLKRWLPLTTTALILVIWQAWSQVGR